MIRCPVSLVRPGLPVFVGTLLCLLLNSCASHNRVGQGAPGRPNIVLIMADDMGFSDISPYGSEIRTPNLDRLAGSGLRFTNFYNTARCCPTRASLLTGLYPHQAGIGHMMENRGFPAYRGDLSEQSVTVAQVLKQSGYGTYIVGKWHITNHIGHWSGNDSLISKHNWPLQRGFDRFYGTIHGAGSYFDPISLTDGNTPVDLGSTPFYYTDAISDHAVQYLTDHTLTRPGIPFFLYVAYTAPHWPLHALPEDIARYRGKYDAGWDQLREQRVERMRKMGIINQNWQLAPRDPEVPAWESLGEQDRIWFARAMEVYAAQIDRMDQGIGHILDALRQSGQLENTLILFLADNGGCAEEITDSWKGIHFPAATRDGRTVRNGNDRSVFPGPEDTYQSYGRPWANVSNTPFRMYKHWVHEGGISTPLIVHWPAQIGRKGRIVREPGHLIDIMATVVDASNAAYPLEFDDHSVLPMEGQSLLPVFAGIPVNREGLFWEHEGNRAVLQGNWKLVAEHGRSWELYDLNVDRTETDNLAARYPDRVNALESLYFRWAERTGVMPWDDVQNPR